MTLRQPTQIGLLDSCPFGLGGFTSNLRFGDSTINNLSEFFVMMITVWLIILDCDARKLPKECILVLGNNTLAIGWLFRSGRIPATSFYYEAVQLIACKLGDLLKESSHILCSQQHLKGAKNVVADLLSYTGASREDTAAGTGQPIRQ
jgi:hypothetical protein